MNSKAYGGRSATVTIVVFSLVFIICCAICVTFFAKAALLSAKASSLNDAVQICRNAAQVFSEKKSAEETARALGGDGEAVWLNEDFQPSDKDSAAYILQCAENRENGMIYGEFSVFDRSGRAVYTLQVGVFEAEAA